MKFTLGTKEEMTQVFGDNGVATPVTVVRVAPLVITQVKTVETDGYNAVQVGYGKRNEKHINKAQKGHFKGAGSFAHVREFRVDDPSAYTVGDTVSPEAFAEGDMIEVSGISKGKGFQGVVKRHGFKGGPRSHGQKHSEREPGSIGATGPQRVFKGTRMGGRMGADRVTVKKLRVMRVDGEAGTLMISGAVPGRRGTVLEIRG